MRFMPSLGISDRAAFFVCWIERTLRPGEELPRPEAATARVKAEALDALPLDAVRRAERPHALISTWRHCRYPPRFSVSCRAGPLST